MGLFNAITSYANKSELRESKDEIVAGAIVHDLTRHGWTAHRIVANADRQQLGFRIPGDELLSGVYLVVDRRSAASAVSAPSAPRTTIGIAAEARRDAVPPAQLASRWREDSGQLLNAPVPGEIRFDHQPATVTARTHHLVDLDQYVHGTEVHAEPLTGWIVQQVDALREAVRPLVG